MTTQTTETKDIWPTVRTMEVGTYESFPIDRSLSLRSICSQLGVAENKVFRTKTDREARTITVYRES